MKALHLGHLAKAFALRDRPGNMGRGGTSGSGSKEKRGHGGGEKRIRRRSGDDGDGTGDGDRRADGEGHDGQEDAARKMRKKMREQAMMGGGAGEFNIG